MSLLLYVDFTGLLWMRFLGCLLLVLLFADVPFLVGGRFVAVCFNAGLLDAGFLVVGLLVVVFRVVGILVVCFLIVGRLVVGRLVVGDCFLECCFIVSSFMVFFFPPGVQRVYEILLISSQSFSEAPLPSKAEPTHLRSQVSGSLANIVGEPVENVSVP